MKRQNTLFSLLIAITAILFLHIPVHAAESGIHLNLPRNVEDPANIYASSDSTVIDSGKCGTDVYYTLYSDGTLKLTGVGEMDNLFQRPWASYENQITSVIISEGITYIGWNAFSSLPGLVNVTLPAGLETIGDNSFSYCPSLRTIILPEGLTEIGNFAFRHSGLISATLPASLSTFASDAFSGCESLTAYKITSGNSGYTTLDGVLFNKSKTELLSFPAGKSSDLYNIPESVELIGNYAFSDCQKVKGVLIPDSVLYIGQGAFEECTSLSTLSFGSGITSTGIAAFVGCTSLTSVVIPDGVTCINSGCFSQCTSLRSITIPNTVTIIETGAFSSCTSLESIILPDELCRLGNSCFESCDNLKSISIPGSVKQIEERSFWGCEKLESAILGYGVTSIDSGAFTACYMLNSISFPDTVNSLGDSAFSSCHGLKKILFPEGLKKISDQCFLDCDSIESLDFPESLISIGNYSFANCKKLTGPLSLPSNLERIGYSAFSGCMNLTSIVLPDSLLSIGNEAFAYCFALSKISINAGLNNLGEEVFKECNNLASISVDKNNNSFCSVNEVLFSKDKTVLYCYPAAKKASSYTLPDTVITVKSFGFSGCQYLKKLILHDKLTEISDYMCVRSSSLSEITIPNSVAKIGKYAFWDCFSLSELCFSGDAPDFGEQCFSSISFLSISIPGYNATWTDSVRQNYGAFFVFWVDIYKPEIIKQPKSSTIVEGNVAKFDVSAEGSQMVFQWYYRTSSDDTWKTVSAASGKTSEYRITAEGRHNGYQYRCKVSNVLGSVYSKIATLTVTTAGRPKILTQPESTTVSVRETASFKVYSIGAENYQWYYQVPDETGWTAVSKNGTSATYSLTTAARHNGYKYRCKISNSSGYIYTNVVTLTVLDFSVTTQPSDKTVSVGEIASFKVVASGTVNYKWYYQVPGETGWTAVSKNGTSATYSLTTAARHNGYKYRCKISNSSGYIYSDVVTLTVLDFTITTQPSDKTVSVGETASFKVVASGTVNYKWYYQVPGETGWTAVSKNGTSATYSLTTAARHNGYKYRCKISNSSGYIYTNVVILTVT